MHISNINVPSGLTWVMSHWSRSRHTTTILVQSKTKTKAHSVSSYIIQVICLMISKLWWKFSKLNYNLYGLIWIGQSRMVDIQVLGKTLLGGRGKKEAMWIFLSVANGKCQGGRSFSSPKSQIARFSVSNESLHIKNGPIRAFYHLLVPNFKSQYNFLSSVSKKIIK